ncbi:MAG: AAA family ATPase [Actinomycetota bacterium]
MLDEIHARNVGLIADAVLTPGAGLTVITGETGTGKTLMLGALRLVSGGPASKGTIGPHEDTAEVGARFFDDAGDEFVVRRVVTGARSRAYLNGVPATAAEVAATVGPLVSIVGQHDKHTLSTSAGVRTLVDAMFTDQQLLTRSAYTEAYRDLRSIEAEMDVIGTDRRGLERELEMTRFQIAEIQDAAFNVGDEEHLRKRLARLRNAEEISTDVAVAAAAVGDVGADQAIRNAIAALDRVSRLDPDTGQIRERLIEAATDISEIAADIARYAETVEADPHALATDEQRLADLSALKRKYGDTIADIDAFAKSAEQRAETIEGSLVAADTLGQRHTRATSDLTAAAAELTDLRTGLAARASSIAVEHLRDLGFARPVVHIAIDPKIPGATGADRFSVMFASDDSLAPAPIGSIASGGELSRLVLALTLACGVADSNVVAFDEIDAGVGGSTALAMGEKLASLARTRQVLCVTHLPQVAAHGDHHFTVVRNGTTATITPLRGPDRTAEISRMLAGMQGSDTAMGHAEELLGRAAASRDDMGVV